MQVVDLPEVRDAPRPAEGAGTRSTKTRAPWAPAVRDAALAEFRSRHPDLELAPVAVVIAALDEGASIAEVLRNVPRRACGLDIDVIVVDDGSTDETSAISEACGAYVARLARNCGHGIALRLGYQLARECGAEYIVTLDGDGQWDPRELPGVLRPVVEDEADFVIGSRILGRTETDDSFRHTGVFVFAWLVRLLTGVAVTDTSSGFRALRADITGKVRQEQIQYQTSELLIGAIASGYRLAERPIVMRRRIAGESKKGGNLLYGFRYARVILRTSWRERRGLKARRRAPGSQS